MRPSDRHGSAETDYDHVVVGAGLSGLAYAWRRHAEGLRVLVLECADGIAPTPAALVEGAAPCLARLLDVVPGAAGLETPACGPLALWTPGGLRSAAPSVLRRLLRRPGSLAGEVRARLAGARPAPSGGIHVLPGGLGALRAALVAALGGPKRVRFGRAVRRVRPAAAADEAVFVDGPEGTVTAREVALDVPAPEQARLLAADAPDPADVLGAVPVVVERVLTLAVGAAPLPPIAGFVRAADGRARARMRMQSALFLSNLAPGPATEGLVEVRYESPDVAGVEAAALTDVARAELGRALGRPVSGRLVGSRSARRVRPEPGHRRRMAELAADLGGRGVRLLGATALGDGPERLASAGVPVPGPLPAGVTLA